MYINLTYGGINYLQCDKEYLLEVGVPTEVIDAAIKQEEITLNESKRKNAYVSESDPLFLEWQFDQTPEKEKAWRDKVAEIKARYPLPTES